MCVFEMMEKYYLTSSIGYARAEQATKQVYWCCRYDQAVMYTQRNLVLSRAAVLNDNDNNNNNNNNKTKAPKSQRFPERGVET